MRVAWPYPASCACLPCSLVTLACAWTSQAVAQQGAKAVAVRLGNLLGQPQVQLDGFKSRTLRSEASTPRDLYLAEWHSVDAATAQPDATLVIGHETWTGECERLPSKALRHELAAMIGGEDWAFVVATVSTRHERCAVLLLSALEVALTIMQAQAAIAIPPLLWLPAVAIHAAGHPEHAGSWGLARSARVEASLPVHCIDGAAMTVVQQHWSLAEPEAVQRRDDCLVPRLAQLACARPHATAPAALAHVVSGGTGGLGLLTARWLAQCGAARSIALASRGSMLPHYPATEWTGLHLINVVSLVHLCDTAQGAHVGRLIAHVMGAASAIGVWHAAGVLADGVLPKQTVESLARVYAPKAHGAWALHCTSSTVVVSTCALFSSVVALLGGAGQANYSAANTRLDAQVTCRRTCARVAASVQWGAWAEVGMAARGAAADRMVAMEAASGLRRIGLAQGLGALHAAVLPQATPLLGVVPVQWERMLLGGVVPTFLSGMVAPTAMKRVHVGSVEQRGACAISLEAVLDMVRRTAGGVVDGDAPLMEAGVDSLGAVELRNQLQHAVGDGVSLSSTLMFDHPTARQVAIHLRGAEPCAGDLGGGNMALTSAGESVEIVGLRATLPMCVSELREMSHCGSDLLCVIPLTRWDVEQAALNLVGSSPEVASRVRHGGFLCNAQLFEHGFFGISAAEAAAMDPQQRQLLERGYSALHAAGLSKAALLGAVIAVNVGQWQSEFGSVLLGTSAGRSVYASTGFSCSVTCGRVSFVLGLQGPCASYDTACSASLVANHGSLRALQRAECASALSAGVNMILEPSTMRGNAVAGFTSVKGRSHTFDARADGYARGEAIDAVACRLVTGDEAVASFASMSGSAIRQDGRSASLTAPNGQAQQSVLGASLVDARAQAIEIAVLEAHGTGTALGDPIEAGAVAAVFLVHCYGIDESLRIGSFKANAGHTEPGAGLAGSFKLLMQLQDASLSPNAQLRTLNPHVGGALRVHAACGLPTQVTRKPAHAIYVGGVSSFGYSGTIAHAVLSCPGSIEMSHTAHRLIYKGRRSFAWMISATSCSSHDAAQKSFYTTCWLASPLPHSSASMTCILLAPTSELASTSAMVDQNSSLKPSLLLAGGVSCPPSMGGERLLLSLVHLVVASAHTMHTMVLTATMSHAAQRVCDAATGGTWGAARNVRLEHSALRVDSCALHGDPNWGALQAFRMMNALSSSSETELIHSTSTCFIPRLRRYRMVKLAKSHESSFPGVLSKVACYFHRIVWLCALYACCHLTLSDPVCRFPGLHRTV